MDLSTLLTIAFCLLMAVPILLGIAVAVVRFFTRKPDDEPHRGVAEEP